MLPARLDHALRRARQKRELRALSPEDRRIVEPALPYTLTSVARAQAVVDAVRHCVRNEIAGAFAECGVWRGGSVLAMVGTLQQLGRDDRDLYLYDTFEGMTAPGEHDVSAYDPPAVETWKQAQAASTRPWAELSTPSGRRRTASWGWSSWPRASRCSPTRAGGSSITRATARRGG